MYSCWVETGQGDLEEGESGEDQKSSLQHSDDDCWRWMVLNKVNSALFLGRFCQGTEQNLLKEDSSQESTRLHNTPTVFFKAHQRC
jgi:hypothetical protein